MKKLLFLIICNIANIAISQNLPQLKLENPIAEELNLSGTILGKDEICIILTTNLGATVYDQKIYYIFKKSGKIESYKEIAPNPNFKDSDLKRSEKKITLTIPAQKYFLDCLNSKITLNFLHYSQSDFTIENNELVKITSIKSHQNKYEITFIQNHNSKSYFYYEPRQTFRDINPRVNKIVLGKFIKLLEIWQMLKT